MACYQMVWTDFYLQDLYLALADFPVLLQDFLAGLKDDLTKHSQPDGLKNFLMAFLLDVKHFLKVFLQDVIRCLMVYCLVEIHFLKDGLKNFLTV